MYWIRFSLFQFSISQSCRVGGKTETTCQVDEFKVQEFWHDIYFYKIRVREISEASSPLSALWSIYMLLSQVVYCPKEISQLCNA